MLLNSVVVVDSFAKMWMDYTDKFCGIDGVVCCFSSRCLWLGVVCLV